MRSSLCFSAALLIVTLSPVASRAQTLLDLDHATSQSAFPIAADGHAAAIYVAPQNPETVRVAAVAFAGDVERVTGTRPAILTSLTAPLPTNLILVGVLGQSPEIDRLHSANRLVTTAVEGKWEAAETSTILNPQISGQRNFLPGVHLALVVAANDRRGAAYALFTLSRQMGVSPWTWWADVPAAHHPAVYVRPGLFVQASPSVQYRGIFLNDEDWGLRPWASKKMDPMVDNGKGNIGPHTYERMFELLLRLHANSLWPAMHPGSLAFNAVPENAKLADKWGIVMGSSHSEALLRNNVGEWNEKAPPEGNGRWNFQTNPAAMIQYWDKRLEENGKFENFYTVGLRGVHDSGLEATGSPQIKAKLVEDVMTEQRKLLAARVNPDVAQIPQIIWLYKESLDLYRVGMKVPDDVTLGWTDDNYGYIRELPNAAEQARPGGSGLYYHVSYWGAPHDHLWLCTTPPALLHEELTKAYDHGVRKYWILNVGDLKPAEVDIDYFMQLATDEPRMAAVPQRDFLAQWFTQQFPTADARKVADVMTRYYALNFIRKPEFMGFNGYNDGINRTAFNPLAWGTNGEPDQNRSRSAAWHRLSEDMQAIAKMLPPEDASAFFELVGYPVEGSAAMNDKFLSTDLTYLDARHLDNTALDADSARAHAAYDTIQTLTAKYNSLEGGKWDGIVSAAPRQRHVFEMPRTATAVDASAPLPASWGDDGTLAPTPPVKLIAKFLEQHRTVSINATHFTRKSDGTGATWNILADLGISGDSIGYGAPGLLANPGAPAASGAWLDYDFITTTTDAPATLSLHLLPTFAVDSDHHLRYAVALDGGAPVELDLGAPAAPHKSAGSGDGPSDSGWADNVLRSSAIATVPLGPLAGGKHTVRLFYRDPGVVFEHLVVTFPGATPAYPVPPETQ
ncbi:MAG TPA: glycosyl hydrolase 115 family protein [Acidobacteriaceae bacterium]